MEHEGIENLKGPRANVNGSTIFIVCMKKKEKIGGKGKSRGIAHFLYKTQMRLRSHVLPE